MLALLDAISRRYGTDPATVYRDWDPFRVTLAAMAVGAVVEQQSAAKQAMAGVKSLIPLPLPVWDVGGL